MTYEIFLALGLFALVTSLTPGPNNLMLMASGANFGWRRTVPHMFGISFGFVVMTILVGIGLIRLFDAFPLSYTVLKALSVAFLVFLAYKIATAAPLQQGSTPTQTTSAQATPMSFIQAALFQWVNPKALAMALSAVTAFAPEGSGTAGIILVALIFGSINLPSIFCWVMLGTQLRRFLNVPWKLRAFNITAAVLLLASLYPILFSHG